MKTKNTLFSGFLLLSTCFPAFSQSIEGKAIIGDWTYEGKVVNVHQVEGQFKGTGKNEDGELVTVLKDLLFEDGTWKGKIYSARRKKYYPVNCKLNDQGVLSLHINTGMIKRTLEWERKESNQ